MLAGSKPDYRNMAGCVALNRLLRNINNLHGAGTRNRTRDLLITSQLLYLLSYTGEVPRIIPAGAGE